MADGFLLACQGPGTRQGSSVLLVRAGGCKIRRCTDRHAAIIDFYLYLAAAIVTLRQLIQRARTLYRWDTRPTTRRLRGRLLPVALSRGDAATSRRRLRLGGRGCGGPAQRRVLRPGARRHDAFEVRYAEAPEDFDPITETTSPVRLR